MAIKKIDKCQNCHERDIELYEIEIEGIKKEVCDACRDGYLLTKKEKSDKLNNNQLANNPPDFTAS